jgi:ribosomal protein L29
MELQDLNKKTDAELREMVRTMEHDIRTMRFQVANFQLKNVRDFRNTRKDIARINTILAQRAKVTNAKTV